ncbi:MAG: LamG-like jellyroll fold domain-containing protein [Caldilineaceae bacterium]
MSTEQTFDFSIEAKPAFTQIDITENNYADIAFTVTNKSERPVRAEAIVIPLAGAADEQGNTLEPEAWGHWLTILEETTYDFDASSVKNYTVRVQLPADLRFGEYNFRLIMVNVADPDGKYAQSDVITFKAVGPQLKVSNFVWLALAAVVAITLLTVLVVMLFQSSTLAVSVTMPTSMTEGQRGLYNIHIANHRPVSATNVLLYYAAPPGIVGATAFVPNAGARQCDEFQENSSTTIRCELDLLRPGDEVTVSLQAIPGPHITVITNTATITVLATLDGKATVAPAILTREQRTTPVAPSTALSGTVVVLDPSAGVATLDEPITYRVLTWTADSTARPLTVRYTLPPGMRYTTIDGCFQPDSYFTLVCPLTYEPEKNKPAEVAIKVVPTEVLNRAPEQKVTATLATAGGQVVVADQVATPVVNSALFFNGISDYVELGYAGVPAGGNLTLEMWVHPFSDDDGQSFAGVHRLLGDDLENLFLAGYWNNGLNIQVGTSSQVLAGPKRTDRYHLAVTIERKDENSAYVTAYINGDPQPWREPDPPSDHCDHCKVFTSTLGVKPTLRWLLGQEWDPGSPDPRPSDFFKGAMSEVRLWNCVRSEAQIERTMNQRLVGNEGGLTDCDGDARGRLIGYWPLTPTTPPTNAIADQGPSHYTGRRFGATWGANLQRFGDALQFNGVSDVITTSVPVTLATALSTTRQLSLTVSAWLKVDSIPTLAEWLVAIPLPVTFGAPPVVVTTPATNTLALAVENLSASQAANQSFWAILLLDGDGHVALAAKPSEANSSPAWDKDEKSIETGRWIHYAGIIGIDQRQSPPTISATLYRDGALVKGRNLPPSTPLTDSGCAPTLYIGGACADSHAFFAGQLDEVRVWARPLGEAEIKEWLNRPDEHFDEVDYWPFDDGPGHNTANLAPNQPPLVLNGPAWVESTIDSGGLIQ